MPFDALQHFGHDILGDNRVSRQLIFCGSDESLIQIEQLKSVAGLHQQQELILGHDLAEFAIALGIFHVLADPGLFMLRQLFRCHVADVGLVGHVSHYIFIGADVVGQLLQIFGFGVYDFFCSLSGTGMQHHIRRVHQHITCAFDYAVHFVHCLTFK